MDCEIIYERDIYKSYMKIQVKEGGGFDERVLLARNFKGTISCKKCYVEGLGQYWYEISGKQALDYYCKLHAVGRAFFERLILSLCDQVERLEWNLVDAGCIRLEPELIFLNQSGDELFFVLYPEPETDVWWEFQRLMEYLLTKLDHSEKEVTKWAYDIYAMTLMDGYSLAEIKKRILNERIEEVERIELDVSHSVSIEEKIREEEVLQEDTKTSVVQIENILQKKMELGKGILEDGFKKWKKKQEKEVYVDVVYPEDVINNETTTIHPTVCLANLENSIEGRLVYEGLGAYPDFEVSKGELCIIGKNPKATVLLDRATISQFHAKIEYTDGNYYIEDMNSTNGTYVNEELLTYKQKRILRSKDIVSFADIKYRFL